MKLGRTIRITALIAGLAGLISIGSALAGGDHHPQPWDIEGAWTAADYGAQGVAGVYVITNTGAGGIAVSGFPAEPPQWPGEARRTPYVGTGRKSGPHEWEYTILSYIQSPAGFVIGFVAGHGTLTLIDPDTVERNEMYGAYLPGQNPFTQAPALGYWGPYVGRGVRITAAPPLGL
jgi:hypothetical protein